MSIRRSKSNDGCIGPVYPDYGWGDPYYSFSNPEPMEVEVTFSSEKEKKEWTKRVEAARKESIYHATHDKRALFLDDDKNPLRHQNAFKLRTCPICGHHVFEWNYCTKELTGRDCYNCGVLFVNEDVYKKQIYNIKRYWRKYGICIMYCNQPKKKKKTLK